MKNKGIASLNGMGMGLLATLVVGTIMVQLGTLFQLNFLIEVGGFAKVLMAAAIGVGVSHALGAKPLVMFSAVVTGCIGAGAIHTVEGQFILSIGEPAGAYLAALVTTLVGNQAHGKTKVDIILVPMVCLIIGGLTGKIISPLMTELTKSIGAFINYATVLKPFYMGPLVSVTMCLVILSPISSAALAVSLGLNGLAAGAAVIGCACSMVGFGIISFEDNGVNGLLSQGIGTSKIQFGNAVKNPYIVIPTMIASLLTGMVGATVFEMQCNSLGAGMGTSGLVGQIQTIAVMGKQGIIGILLCHFILPAIISWSVWKIMSSKGYIKKFDMLLLLN